MEHRNRYLLLVDGDCCARKPLREVLAARGYAAVTVGDDEGAVYAATRIKFFAALLARGSRKDGGLALVQQLLSVDPRLPCVALIGTADAMVDEAVQALIALERLAVPACLREKTRNVAQVSFKVVA
jgi:ActR/RegA family two-component response regulator